MAPRKQTKKQSSGTAAPTNRIRDIREAAGMTAERLATLAKTTAAQISRLEAGSRKLTETWMRRIASALDVEPADLLEVAAFVKMEDEVEPYVGGVGDNLLSAISARQLLIMKIKTNQLEDAGIPSGYEALFNMDPEALKTPTTGDILLLDVTRKSDGAKARFVRQFLAPHTLMTNRRGRNLAIDLHEPRYSIEITGVLQRARNQPKN